MRRPPSVSNLALVLLLSVLPSVLPFVVLSPSHHRHHRHPSLVQQHQRTILHGIRACDKDDNNEGNKSLCNTINDGRRSRKIHAVVAVTANSMACFLAGMSLGGPVSLAVTSSYDVVPSERSYTTTGLVVSLEAPSLPNLSDFKLGFGGSSSSTPSQEEETSPPPVTEEQNPEPSVSEQPPSAAITNGNDGEKRSKGGFSLPNLKLDFSNNDNDKRQVKELTTPQAVVPESTIVDTAPPPESVTPESTVVDTIPSPLPNTEIKSNRGFSLPGFSDITDIINPSEEKRKETEEKRVVAAAALEEKKRLAEGKKEADAAAAKRQLEERREAAAAAVEKQKRESEERRATSAAAAEEKNRIADEKREAVAAAAKKQAEERREAAAAAVEETKRQAAERREAAAANAKKMRREAEEKNAARTEAIKSTVEGNIPMLDGRSAAIPALDEISQRIERNIKESEEKEQDRREKYRELQRQKEIEKEMKIREYDEMFRKQQEERDQFYGQRALENKRDVEELKREERDFVQKGIFNNSPLQIPTERGGDELQGRTVLPVTGNDNVLQKEQNAATGMTDDGSGKFQGQYVNGMERRSAAATERKEYNDRVALRKAREEVARLEKRVESEQKLNEIRENRLKEQELVRERAEINAMKLQQAKARNAEIRLKESQELRERQLMKIEQAREIREQAAFDRRMVDLDKYETRKEKLEERKLIRQQD